MADKIKELPKKFLEWLKKFTIKQRIIMGIGFLVVLIVLIGMVKVITKPEYTTLVNCESTKEAAEVVALLDGDGISYKVSDDGLRISIMKKQLSQANLLLGENGIPTSRYTIEEALGGGLSTTEADKRKKYLKYTTEQLEEDLEAYSFVKRATVELYIPEDNGTLISSGAESSAAVSLDLKEPLTTEKAQALARFVATALGNSTTNSVVIMDYDGNLYFSGADEVTANGTVNSVLSIKQQEETSITTRVRANLSGTGEFSMISVALNLDIDYSTHEDANRRYTPADGQSQGVLSSESRYESESTGVTGGVPGTSSNDETVTYELENGSNSSETVTEYRKEYLPNEETNYTTTPAGAIKLNSSSISVTTISYNIIKEEDAKKQGLLDGISWEEYKLANSERTKLEVDPDWVAAVVKGSGIPEANISFLAYSENMFIDKEGSSVKATDIMQIVLIVVILALLAFVVLRSMRGEKKKEVEEELSVETLIQSTPVETLEDIGLEEKSETRRIVDKFVDDNPEAAASLLRNWLNEDWG